MLALRSLWPVAVIGAVVLAAAVALGLALRSDSGGTPIAPEASPTGTPRSLTIEEIRATASVIIASSWTPTSTATPPVPVPPAVPRPVSLPQVTCSTHVAPPACGFAAQAEALVRARDVASLLAGSTWAGDEAQLKSILERFAAAGGSLRPRLVAMECDLSPSNTTDCSDVAGYLFSTLPAFELHAPRPPSTDWRYAALLLAFNLHDQGRPRLTTVSVVTGTPAATLLEGGRPDNCLTFPASRTPIPGPCSRPILFPTSAQRAAEEDQAPPEVAACPDAAGQVVCEFAGRASVKGRDGGVSALLPKGDTSVPAGTASVRLLAIGCTIGAVASPAQTRPERPDCSQGFSLFFAPIGTLGPSVVVSYVLSAEAGFIFAGAAVADPQDIDHARAGAPSVACGLATARTDGCLEVYPIRTALS